MKRMLHLIVVLSLCWLGVVPIWAQGITKRDSEEIKRIAQRKVEKGLCDLLNTLTFDDLNETERKGISEKSYSADKVRLFYNGDVIIEDDLQPDRPVDQVADLKVPKYLANLDLFYTKSAGRTIEFSNVKVSNVKERNYVYTKVYYTQLFKGKNSQSEVAFRPVQRVAEVRAEQVGKKWIATISQVGFVAAGDSAASTLNDVALAAEVAPVDSAAILAKQEQDAVAEALRKQELEKEVKAQQTYNEYLTAGDQAFRRKDYQTALIEYGKADKWGKYNNYDDETPTLQLARTNRQMNAARVAEQDLLREYGEKGEIARKRRNYSEALGYYHKVLDKKPDSTALQAVVKELTQKANIKTEYDEQYVAGQYEKLVDEYDKIIKKDKDNSDWYLGRAKCYLKLNKDDRALKDLTESLRLDYANLDALVTRAELYRKQNNLPKAITDYSACLTIDPTNDNAFAQRAQLRVQNNNFASADEDYSQAINLLKDAKPQPNAKQSTNPKLSTYLYERGVLRYRTAKVDPGSPDQEKNYEPAIADFTEAIKLSAEKPDPYFWRGMAYAIQKKYTLTGADFANATKRKLAEGYSARVDSVQYALYSLGFKDNEAGQFEPAIAHLTDALAVRSDLPKALYERGRARLSLKDYPEAVKDLTASIGIDAAVGPAYDRRAEAYTGLGQYEQAAADYHKSSVLVPTNYAAYLGEATALIELKKYQEAMPPLLAVKTVQKKIEKNYTPTFFRDVFYRLGRSEYAIGQFEPAVDDYASALKFDENFAAGYSDRGAAYEALGKFDRAVDDYQRAIDQNPALPDRYLAKATALEKKGDFTTAIGAYNDVIRTDSLRQFYTKALLHRGMSYLATGQYAEAIADLEQPVVQADTAVCRYDCWLNTGLAHLYAGKPDAGVPYLAKCLTTPPYAARAAYATACASLQKDNEAEALTWFEKAFQDKALTSSDVKKDKLIDVARKDFRRNKSFKQLMDKYLK